MSSLAFSSDHPSWAQFKELFDKTYSAEEETLRKDIYHANLHFIDHQNSLGHGWTLGVGPFADLTHEEFKAHYLSTPRDYSARLQAAEEFQASMDGDDDPGSVDWRTKGAVTPVKNQGQCGSCWSFSTTGSVEGQHFLATGNLVSLSEQNLVDCSTQNSGCNGGVMDYAFEYIIQNGGIDTEASYPYTASQGTCQYNPANIGAKITGYTDVTSGSISAMKQAVAQVGPISVAMDASPESFQHYKSGIWDPPGCSPGTLDHGVLVVGYNTNSTGTEYWIVKNSWGTGWGLKGYFEIASANNECGICTTPSYPTGASSDVKQARQ